jgi:queuine tRNA-ribosyltransferase
MLDFGHSGCVFSQIFYQERPINMYPNFSFDILKKSFSSRARRARITTPHGVVETPNFIFCATKASIKGVSPEDMKEAGTQIILSNTYHLMVYPGSKHIEKMGGIHKFMGWSGPMLTDSGGFQIFSLGHGSVASEIKGKRMNNRPQTLLKITQDGAVFRSYLNGEKHFLTPEKSIQIQHELGVDLVVVLDECTPFHVDKTYTKDSMNMSHRWALRSLREFERLNDGRQALYGITQGGIYPDLRRESTDFLNNHPFFGSAVGGSLGASKDQMHDVVAVAMENLTQDRPVHLLGIGGVQDIFNGVRQGIDTFDCVHPTRLARHGGALVKGGEKEHLNLKNSKFKEDPDPIDTTCGCSTCQNFSKSYLHYLLHAGELLYVQLITVHNVYFMNRLMRDIRECLEKGESLEDLQKVWSGFV